jgi:hypothetical protein
MLDEAVAQHIIDSRREGHGRSGPRTSIIVGAANRYDVIVCFRNCTAHGKHELSSFAAAC